MSDRCPRCGRFMGNRKVGLGSNPVWICLACFESAMAKVGEQIRHMRRALLPEPDGRNS